MELVRRSISYFRPDLAAVILLLLMIGASVVLNLLHAWPIAVLIDAVLSERPRASAIHRLFLAPFGEDRVNQIIGLAALATVIRILQEVVLMARMMLNARLRYNGTARVRAELYDKLQELNLAWHLSRPQGDSIYRLSYDATGPWGVLEMLIGSGAAAVTLTGMTVVMLWRHVPLTLLSLAILPLLIVANRYFGPRIRHRAAESKQTDADLVAAGQRGLASILLTQAFGRESHESRRYAGAVDKSVRASMRLSWKEYLYPLAIQSSFALGTAVIFGYGGYLVYRNRFFGDAPNGLSAGDLLVFMAYLNQFWDPLGWVLGFTTKVQPFVASSERVFEVLDFEPAVVDSPVARRMPVRPRTLILKDVGFSYGAGRAVLGAVNARIEPGMMVAFIGPSGTGKSTLLNLLLRFYDPTAGSVRLDGWDLRELKLADVRAHSALVSQESLLFPGTIAENLRYGRPEASDEEVRAAAAEAGADRFIAELPLRYDTEIEEGGQNLSGGQRQRLAIARALLTKAPFLVLDEPTSALDPAHERLVVETLRGIKGKRTIILVTHRYETVVDCDRVYLMRDGTVVEDEGSERGEVGRVAGS